MGFCSQWQLQYFYENSFVSPNLTCGCRFQMLEINRQVLCVKGMVIGDFQVLYSCTSKKFFFH